jgi:hypothetical protein
LIILVIASPLPARDRDRFGIDMFHRAGLPLEVWDVHQIYLPRPDFIATDTAGLCYRIFKEESAFVEACQQLEEDTVVITLCGMMVGEELKYHRFREALLTSKALVGTVYASNIPPPPQATSAGHAYRRVLRGLSKVLSGRLRSSHVARRFSDVRALRAAVPSQGRKPLIWQWVGPGESPIDPRVLGPETLTRHLHTWDYDQELRNPVIRSERRGVLFLDSMGPVHPDFAVLGMRTFITPESWFRYIRRELTRLNGESGQHILIAAHPRALPGSLDAWYEPFEVRYGQTRDLIANSCFVVAAEPSTALGLCALYDTPVLLLDPPKVHEGQLEYLATYRDLLPRVDVDFLDRAGARDRTGDNRDISSVSFVQRFLRDQDSPLQPFWATVIDDIQVALVKSGHDDGV